MNPHEKVGDYFLRVITTKTGLTLGEVRFIKRTLREAMAGRWGEYNELNLNQFKGDVQDRRLSLDTMLSWIDLPGTFHHWATYQNKLQAWVRANPDKPKAIKRKRGVARPKVIY